MPDNTRSRCPNASAAKPEPSWEGLLARLAERDVAALETLYDVFAPQLFGLLMRILPARRPAEAALQEVFLRLWKEAARLAQGGGSVAVWLVLTARQAALERLRVLPAAPPAEEGGAHPPLAKREKPARQRVGASSRTPPPLPAFRVPSATLRFLEAFPELWMPRPQEVALAHVRLDLLHRAYDQMPKPQRRALEMALFHGYTEAEIAARLGEPQGKVSAGLRAAFTFLRHRQQAVLGTWTADI
jgi:RNA polymerase sigma factor (sigma-70 family)